MDELEMEQATKPERQKRKPEAYKNISNGAVHVCGNRVDRGDSYELTTDDKKQGRSMKRLERAVELGLIEKV